MKSVEQVIRERSSQRVFAPRCLTPMHREAILWAAVRAPTAGNMMLYSLIEVEDQARKERLAETCDHQPFIAKAPYVLLFLADMQRWFDFYHHADVPAFCARSGIPFRTPDLSDLLLASCDALIAAQNTVLMAESLGIGSCYVGDILENYEVHRDMFQLPPWAFPVTLLCFGYFPEGCQRVERPRFQKRFVVHRDSYHRLSAEELDAFSKDEPLRKFAGGFVGGAENAGQHIYGRKTGAPFSREMARSVRQAIRRWCEGAGERSDP